MSGYQQPLARTDEPTGEPPRANAPPASGRMPTDVASPQAKLVYLAVREYGPLHVEELKEGLGLSGLTLYPILQDLASKGHVTRTGQTCTLGGGTAP